MTQYTYVQKYEKPGVRQPFFQDHEGIVYNRAIDIGIGCRMKWKGSVYYIISVPELQWYLLIFYLWMLDETCMRF